MTKSEMFKIAYATKHMPRSFDDLFGKELAAAAKREMERLKVDHDGRSRNTSTAGALARAVQGRAKRAPFVPVVVELHKKGLSIGQIGEEIGRSYTFARSVLADAGLS